VATDAIARSTRKRDPRPTARRGVVHRNASSAAQRYEAMLTVLMCFRSVINSMRRHYRWVERRCGVSGAQVWALAQIEDSPGMTVGGLARQLAIHQSTASNLLEKLEQGRLVTRTRDADDRRVVLVQLTARGRNLLQRAPRPKRGVLQEALLELPAARLTALRNGLALLNRHMSAHGTDRSTILSDVIGSV